LIGRLAANSIRFIWLHESQSDNQRSVKKYIKKILKVSFFIDLLDFCFFFSFFF